VGLKIYFGMKLVLLTAGYSNGRRLARALYNAKIKFEIVTICHDLPRKKASLKYVFKFIYAHIKSISFIRDFAFRNRVPYPIAAQYAGFCNGKRLIRILQNKKPAYIFMMGGGILNEEVIKCASKGVLNAHPGLLPWIRGTNAIIASILNNVAVGVTLHYIDKGIDTGPVIERYLQPIGDKNTLEEIKLASDHLSILAMLNAALILDNGGELKGTVQSKKYPINKIIKGIHRKEVDQYLSEGLAKQLYDKWLIEKPWLIDGKTLIETTSKYL